MKLAAARWLLMFALYADRLPYLAIAVTTGDWTFLGSVLLSMCSTIVIAAVSSLVVVGGHQPLRLPLLP